MKLSPSKEARGIQILSQNIETLSHHISDLNFHNWNVLITGGAGFLGSWLGDILVKKQAIVTCLDNLSSGLIGNITGLKRDPHFSFIRQDITEPMKIKKKIDFVIHMASRASPFEFSKYPLEILRANTLGTMNALEIARKHKSKFLYTSTSEIYGEPEIVPTPESYRGNVSSIGIRSCYDEGKRCGEALVMTYHRQYDLDTRIARIFNTYGPRMRGDDVYGRVIPRFIEQCIHNEPITVFGTGNQTRSFCYVTDQLEGLLRLASSDAAKGKVINVGNNTEISIIELAKTIKDLTKSNSEITFLPMPPDDPSRRCPDISIAQTLLRWEPRTKLAIGLADFIQWIRNKEDR